MDDESLSLLDPGDLAAFKARQSWLIRANDPDRRGKQLLPDGDWTILLWRAGRGFGKEVPLTEVVPTPDGFKRIGELLVGDVLFDENGRVCRVTQLHPIDLMPESYRVAFSDGSYVDACGDHRWVTWTHRDRKQYQRYEKRDRFPDDWVRYRMPLSNGHSVIGEFGPEIRTTREIRETLRHGKRGDLNHCIPQCCPLDLPDIELPIMPYALGYWLGNGTAASGDITTGSYDGNHDVDHVVGIIRLDPRYGDMRVLPSGSEKGSRVIRSGVLLNDLRANGLIGNKHIPERYLRASILQREMLLKGLMDSDGGVDNANSCSFSNSNRGLVDGVYELLMSLGMKATRDERIPRCQNGEGQKSYRVVFSPTREVFSLPRKACLLNFDVAQVLRRHHRMIVSVEPIPSVPMRCITVDSPNGMFLVGRSMIPTHNSEALLQAVWWDCYRYPGLIAHVLAPTRTDLRGTLFEGPVGLCNLVPETIMYGEAVDKAYNKTTHEMKFKNGSIVRGYATTEEANRLRGPQCSLLAGDELAAWDVPAGNLETAFNVSMFGVRLPYPDGSPARAIFGTTPRPIPFLKRMERRDDVKVIVGSSLENIKNLSGAYRSQIMSLSGTKIGRQEIEAIYVDDDNDQSIFKRNWFKLWPAEKKLPEFSFIVECYDTAFTEDSFDKRKQDTDPTACLVLGVFNINAYFTPGEREKLGVKSKYGTIICEAWDARLGFPELLEKARSQHKIKWGSPGRRSDLILIEEKGSGISMRQALVKFNVPTWPYNPGRQSKLQRANAVSPLVRQGMVFIPESAREDRKGLPRAWLEPFLEQVCAYYGPGTTEHDDYCFVADTKILMANGCEKRIADVLTGEMVSTPDGPRVVTVSGFTGVKPTLCVLYENGSLVGTGNHPIWCDGQWMPLALVRNGDCLTSTGAKSGSEARASGKLSILRKSGNWLLRGISQKKAEGGTVSRPKKTAPEKESATGYAPLLLLRHAFNAAKTWSASRSTKSFAHPHAVRKVIGVRSAPDAPVYNLTVDGSHCFYANGVLVHNCDTLSMGLLYLRNRGVLEATPDEKYLDLEDKRDKEEREAERAYSRSRQGRMGNPYG